MAHPDVLLSAVGTKVSNAVKLTPLPQDLCICWQHDYVNLLSPVFCWGVLQAATGVTGLNVWV
jgi:hypothetical protein